MTKAIVYFLPQFHEIPENNEWWGEGFTEWTNLKKARPLFEGHHQPNEPLNDNYYNLLDKETVIWQTELAKKYSVYAFNYYHYWFKGRKILEKPAENLLKWKDIDQKFMFMWANHDWTRSWVGGTDVLLKMDYGEENDWIEHINYLMQFFKDKRYLKISNKPIFEIYIPSRIPDLDKMIAVWDIECKRNGFDGIYIISHVDYEIIRKKNFSKSCNAIVLQEHSSAIQYMDSRSIIGRVLETIKKLVRSYQTIHYGIRKIHPYKMKIYSYDAIVNNSVKLMKSLNLEIKTYFGVCTGWDNTPRYGRNGYIVDGATPEKFKNYLLKAKKLSERLGQEYIFIACWNEWCEGMCLEPTKKDNYGYLEAVREVFGKDK